MPYSMPWGIPLGPPGLESTFQAGRICIKMELKHDILLTHSPQGGERKGQEAGPTRPAKGWGEEGGIQDNIQIGGLNCSATRGSCLCSLP